MANTQENQVAIFIDYQNMRGCDWPRIIQEADKLGRVIIRRAYADWTNHRTDHHKLLGMGVEVYQVSSKRGKNAADIRIAIDAMDLLLDKRTNITHVVLVSGDGDFTDLVNRLKFYDKRVTGIGMRQTTADYLREACDDYLFYEDLIGNRQPPRRSENRPPAPPSRLTGRDVRELLAKAMQSQGDEWISAGKLKRQMQVLDERFDEKSGGYATFMLFLTDMSDVVETRYASGGHLEVRLRPASPPPRSPEIARQLLVQAMEYYDDPWVLASRLKPQIRRLDPDFDESQYGYPGFNIFVEAQADLVQTRRRDDGNMEVQLVTTADKLARLRSAEAEAEAEAEAMPMPTAVPEPATAVPEPATAVPIVEPTPPPSAAEMLAQYIDYLRQERVVVTPSEHRARIVLKLYELYKKRPSPGTLTQLRDELLAYFAPYAAQISEKLVTEVVYQLFWAHCFEFDQTGDYPVGVRLWDRVVTLIPDITNRSKLLARCDAYLLGLIQQRLGTTPMDRQVVMQLLYGRIGSDQMAAHIDQLLAQLQP